MVRRGNTIISVIKSSTFYSVVLIVFLLQSCVKEQKTLPVSITDFSAVKQSEGILNYKITPKSKFDKRGLMFSDEGAWFAFSIPDTLAYAGFSGPFLLTQQNGIWASKSLAYLAIKNQTWKSHHSKSYTSHLEQVFTSDTIELKQELVFLSGHTAVVRNTIKNISNKEVSLSYQWKNSPLMADGLLITCEENKVIIKSTKTNAVGYLSFDEKVASCVDNIYETELKTIRLVAGEQQELIQTISFIFPEYSYAEEEELIKKLSFDTLFKKKLEEKNNQLKTILAQRKGQFINKDVNNVAIKAHLTLQNNWRIPAGEIKHEGLFPSYHYKWFNGFWSWDSWKHAVGLAYYDTRLAKEQIKLMFDFQNEDGFVADCVYRDTNIEAHNYRDTKPPLAAWAVEKVFEKTKDTAFVKEMYPKLKNYHYWWYQKRDHDQDGLCEYGSTDGSLVAAKWESGMDNAIRFDHSKILKNGEGAFSLDQESVDLNAYLYAEKKFLARLSEVLELEEEKAQYLLEAEELKRKIQTQFYDASNGWFYDTTLDGKQFIRGEGSEGWTSLWTKVATQEQATKVKERMMDSTKFFTRVPFQTMSSDHKKFDPLKGYWRGPNWLDQAYFGMQGLRNYGFNTEADLATLQLIKGAEGILTKGSAIRENYHPLTGKGLHAYNFSWSAAHLLMMVLED